MTKKVNLLISGLSLILLSIPTNVLGYEAATQSAQNTTNLPVGTYMGLDCEDGISFSVLFGFGYDTGNISCNVISNSINGYEINISSIDLTGNPGGDIISSMSATPSILNQNEITQWGINTNMGATVDDNSWIGSGVVSTALGPTFNEGTLYNYLVGINIGSQAQVQAATYSGHLTVTASSI